MSDAPLHSPEAHDVISAELTACILGQRQRPELRVDTAGLIRAGIDRALARLALMAFPVVNPRALAKITHTV